MKRMNQSQLMKELERAPLPAELAPQNRQKLLEMIADRIRTYWRFRESTDAAKTAAEIYAMLRSLQAGAESLRKEFRELPEAAWREIARAAGRSDWGYGLPLNEAALPPGLARGHVLVKSAHEVLSRFEQWVGESLARTPKARKGRKPNDDRSWLVGQIASVYERYTGLAFNGGSKSKATPTDLIKQVLAIADPQYRQTTSGVEKLRQRAIAKKKNWPPLRAAPT